MKIGQEENGRNQVKLHGLLSEVIYFKKDPLTGLFPAECRYNATSLRFRMCFVEQIFSDVLFQFKDADVDGRTDGAQDAGVGARFLARCSG